MGSILFNIIIEPALLLLGLVGGTELNGHTLGDALELSLFAHSSTGSRYTEWRGLMAQITRKERKDI